MNIFDLVLTVIAGIATGIMVGILTRSDDK